MANKKKQDSGKENKRGRIPGPCKVCGKKLTRTDTLKVHMRSHTGERPYSCEICHRKFIQSAHLQTHIQVTHKTEKPFQCKVCGASFPIKSYLTMHMRTHTKERPYKCEICDQKFTQPGSKITHMKRHKAGYKSRYLREPRTGEVHCPVCNKVISCKANLGAHMVVHTDEKPFQCDKCEHQFKTLARLKAHMVCHSDERKFLCTTCGMTFKMKGSLDNHARIHTSTKDFVCYYCDRAFSRKDYLKAHVRIHTGEKPYKCEKCDQCFTQSSTLRAHLKAHTNHENGRVMKRRSNRIKTRESQGIKICYEPNIQWQKIEEENVQQNEKHPVQEETEVDRDLGNLDYGLDLEESDFSHKNEEKQAVQEEIDVNKDLGDIDYDLDLEESRDSHKNYEKQAVEDEIDDDSDLGDLDYVSLEERCDIDGTMSPESYIDQEKDEKHLYGVDNTIEYEKKYKLDHTDLVYDPRAVVFEVRHIEYEERDGICIPRLREPLFPDYQHIAPKLEVKSGF